MKIWLIPVGALLGGGLTGYLTAPRPALAALTLSPSNAGGILDVNSHDTTVEAGPAQEALTVANLESLTQILGYPSPLHRRAALKRHFEGLASAEFPLALAILRNREELSDTEVLPMLFRVWAERAPDEGARNALTLPADVREQTVGAFARAWLRRDPEAAHAWAEKNLSGTNLRQFQSYARSEADARTSVPGSIDEIMALPESNRESALRRHFSKISQENPLEALTQIVRLPDENLRQGLAVALLRDCATRDPAGFLSFLDSAEAGDLGKSLFATSARLSAATALAEKDPHAARAYAEAMPAGGQRNQFTDYVAAVLVKTDRDAAFEMVEKYQAETPDAPFNSFLRVLVDLDPARAAPMLTAQIDRMEADKSGRPGTWVVGVMKDWIKKDPAAASEFGTALPASTHSSVFYAIGKEWCRADGPGALRWAASQASGGARDEAMRQMTYCWAENDSTQTTAWLETLPRDSGRWAATEGFIFATVDRDPDGALAWLRSIPDESKRQSILPRLWRDWSKRNFDSAQDWLEHGGLTEAERKVIDEAP